MAFLIQCDNKGCMKLQNSQLDLSTNEVICMECGNSIKNITVFTKNQLKSMGQTTKKKKSQQSYAVKCEHCNITDLPILDEGVLFCKQCNKELQNISGAFKNLLHNVLNNVSK